MHRMDVLDRFENDPAFRALVELMTSWLMQHSEFTPTELREAAMVAAHRVDLLTTRRAYTFDMNGTLIPRDERQ